jgi:hypothetical protein
LFHLALHVIRSKTEIVSGIIEGENTYFLRTLSLMTYTFLIFSFWEIECREHDVV